MHPIVEQAALFIHNFDYNAENKPSILLSKPLSPILIISEPTIMHATKEAFKV